MRRSLRWKFGLYYIEFIKIFDSQVEDNELMKGKEREVGELEL